MITKKDLQRITPQQWEIPAEFREDMRVPARIFATDRMLDQVLSDRSIEQLVNVSTLPGIQTAAMVMPDVHEGYGFPIGGVAGMLVDGGVISPGGIGYDINCGVRLLTAEYEYAQIEAQVSRLGAAMFSRVPSGVGKAGAVRLNRRDLDDVLRLGASWMVKNGYGRPEDLLMTESGGRLENAEEEAVSDKAKKRGHDQLGTLGGGNHFIEIDVVEEIYDAEAAEAYGLFRGQAVVQIHTGSRGLGHQVATDYVKVMMSAMQQYGIRVPDRELACAPFGSAEGQSYFAAMSAASNFAWANRQAITHQVRESWKSILGPKADLALLYDVAHNIAKLEDHEVDGEVRALVVHRKGATRAFGPGHPELPPQYRKTGQPVIIPGSMGTASYVLAGTETGMKLSFGSSCHGAGRRMSRGAARRSRRGEQVLRDLSNQGVQIYNESLKLLAEEAPEAYKGIDEVVGVIDAAGIATKVVRLRPKMVIKG